MHDRITQLVSRLKANWLGIAPVIAIVVGLILFGVSLDRFLASEDAYSQLSTNHQAVRQYWLDSISKPMSQIRQEQNNGLRPEFCDNQQAHDLMIKSSQTLNTGFDAFFVEYDQPKSALGIWRGNRLLNAAEELVIDARLAVIDLEATCVFTP